MSTKNSIFLNSVIVQEKETVHSITEKSLSCSSVFSNPSCTAVLHTTRTHTHSHMPKIQEFQQGQFCRDDFAYDNVILQFTAGWINSNTAFCDPFYSLYFFYSKKTVILDSVETVCQSKIKKLLHNVKLGLGTPCVK